MSKLHHGRPQRIAASHAMAATGQKAYPLGSGGNAPTRRSPGGAPGGLWTNHGRIALAAQPGTI
jgi:hypothetical protein